MARKHPDEYVGSYGAQKKAAEILKVKEKDSWKIHVVLAKKGEEVVVHIAVD